ncbi:uncharacterized protein LOC108462774 [Gossypium arboreum]|uniref:uncharacterized protein LOC108462774 n=1 Tax=Gossypium arboreum TaxID=29729 RepID=UPI0022F14941|nr:uncharacterized protein LOC108462774 [Gossypium arboreum]
MTPDRITLQNMEKRPNESFRQNAQRWREVAMQVQPPLLEKETTMLFINTLKASFITHMVGSTTKSFADIVMAGEIIENAIRGGKIEGETAKRSAPRRKDNEVNNTSSYNPKAVTVSQPRVTTVGQQDSQKHGSGSRQNSEKVSFTPIPVTYQELYQSLFNAHAIAHFHLKPLQPPYPKWYDANAKCEYHVGISGHSIENCTGFKKVVERLIKMGVVKFNDTPSNENPLPNHGDQGVNAFGDIGTRKIKEGVAEVRTLMKVIWEEMVKKDMIISKERNRGVRDYCEFHAEEGHEIQECEEFKVLVQGLMDNKELEFYEASSDEGYICTLKRRPKNQNRPRIIISLPRNNEVEIPTVPKVIIHKPVSFPYKDNKRVPWNYNCNVTMPEKEDIASASKEVRDEGSYTRSGKRYDAEDVRVEPTKAKAFDKGKRTEILVNEPVKEEEAREFLKFLKHSEYSVVEQLRKQPARISVLALLLSLEVHREALINVLNETYVTNDISVNKLDRLVSNISADNFIYFNDDEIPPGGMGSAKALHITTRCKGYTLPSLLIDNGSTLNVMPLSILNRLPIDRAVPSSLHQKLKLVADGRLVTINAEEDIIATVTSDAPYVEANEEAIECSFHSLEFINATFILEGNKDRLQAEEERNREAPRQKSGVFRWKRGRVGTDDIPPYIPNLCIRGIIHPGGGLLEEGSYYINAVHNEGFGQGNLEGIRPYEPGSFLNNWVAEELPDFEDDRDCDMSPDLLRMVKQEEKQILPCEKEVIENVALEEGNGVKIGTHVTKETRQGLVELLREFKDIFA